MEKSRKYKWNSLLQLLILLGIVAAANFISAFVYERLDLTEDKRYTLSPVTVAQLEALEDVVFVKVYLEGDLPAGFRRLRQATREMLEEMSIVSDGMLQYEFTDPLEGESQEDKRYIIEQLSGQGLEPVNLEVQQEDEMVQKIIFPGAIVSYRDKTVPVQLLQQQMGQHPEQVLHNSIVGLEWGLMNSVRRLLRVDKPKIAFIYGQGETDTMLMSDFRQALRTYYRVEDVLLPKYKVGKLQQYDLAIVAKPDTSFSELSKYKLDQFVMHGGKVLWLIDRLQAELGMLDETGVALTTDYPLNITEDLLFTYGVRVNPNLVQSVQSGYIPLFSGGINIEEWPYFPLAYPASDHPIVNNLNPVLMRFANTLDTVQAPNVEKIPLLASSPASRALFNPVRINLQMVRITPDPSIFNEGRQLMAVLLKGRFTSVFRNRLAPNTLESGEYGTPKEISEPTSQIVVADGDVIQSQFDPRSGQIFPLGYDQFTRQTFGNKTFLMNAVDYLIDESGIISLRNKNVTLRLLDRARVQEEKLQWQLGNMAIPPVLLVLFGIIYHFIRKRKYTR